MTAPAYDLIECTNAATWRQWLSTHYADTEGIWLKYYKKDSGIESVRYAEALDVALCYGWIDGQAQSIDDVSYRQKYTPRRARSMWSKRNIEHVARLTAAGLMTPAGLAEVERAKQAGRWQAAYDSPTTMTIPDEFMVALSVNPAAATQFETLNKSDRYLIGMRLQTAVKPETKARRIATFIKMLEVGERPR